MNPDNNMIYHQHQFVEEAPAPVKIVGHKSINSRKKGLSLVSYPKSFLVGNRNMTKTTKTTTNKPRPGSKTKYRRPNNLVTMSGGGPRALRSPPL